ncbi:MAG: RNA methyltransferase [Deltaproteobacteria bacterium]|nr:RNA methyltransferase [Deltaproteobacteria bacterium]
MVKGVAKNISIVLVEPRGAGNIGSVCRAMKNNGLKDLRLVNPVPYMTEEGKSMACNATDMLQAARVFPTLDVAIKDAPLVVGTTRRRGKLRFPTMNIDEAIPEIIKRARKNRVAILFGREDKGLKNEETEICDILLEIPSHRDYASINLAQAVFVVCHYIFRAENPVEPSYRVAPREDVELFYGHIEKMARKLGYGEKVKGEFIIASILRNFRRLFGRTGLMHKEVNMMRGLITRIEEEVE